MSNTSKWILVISSLILGWALIGVYLAKQAEATFNPMVTICHKPSNPDQTLSVSLAALGGHLGHGDSLGACAEIVVPTVTPTSTPSPTTTPSPTPTVIEEECQECEEVTPTPTEELIPTPTEGFHPQPCNGCSNPPSAPVCQDGNVGLVPLNFHVVRSGDKATLKWIPTAGDKVNIYYKNPKSSAWEHAVRDSDNDGVEVINGLGKHDWTFGLQQHSGCAGGPIANVIDGNVERTFFFSYWSW